MHAFFLASVYSLVPVISAVYCELSDYSQVWARRLEEFRKNNKRLARNETFCGHGVGKNGAWKRQVTLYLQFYGSES